MRALLMLAVLVLVVSARTRGPSVWRSKLPSAPPRRDELVKDPVCQTYVLMSRAIRSEAGGHLTFFCSRECAERFQHGDRRG